VIVIVMSGCCCRCCTGRVVDGDRVLSVNLLVRWISIVRTGVVPV